VRLTLTPLLTLTPPHSHPSHSHELIFQRPFVAALRASRRLQAPLSRSHSRARTLSHAQVRVLVLRWGAIRG
jgi:hypothetical protein